MSLEEITDELNREMEQRRRDERLFAALQEQAIAMHAEVYLKEVAKGKKKYKAMTGFMLQSIFGRKKSDGEPLWMIKDLDVEQLIQLIKIMSNKTKKVSRCCGAPLETKETEVPNRLYQFDSRAPKTKMSRRKFCTKCGNRNVAPVNGTNHQINQGAV
jgi:hypothetical protein